MEMTACKKAKKLVDEHYSVLKSRFRVADPIFTATDLAHVTVRNIIEHAPGTPDLEYWAEVDEEIDKLTIGGYPDAKLV